MKGIKPVTAIILLIAITVALVGLTFYFVSDAIVKAKKPQKYQKPSPQAIEIETPKNNVALLRNLG